LVRDIHVKENPEGLEFLNAGSPYFFAPGRRV
jgi:hypothetical protein